MTHAVLFVIATQFLMYSYIPSETAANARKKERNAVYFSLPLKIAKLEGMKREPTG